MVTSNFVLSYISTSFPNLFYQSLLEFKDWLLNGLLKVTTSESIPPFLIFWDLPHDAVVFFRGGWDPEYMSGVKFLPCSLFPMDLNLLILLFNY